TPPRAIRAPNKPGPLVLFARSGVSQSIPPLNIPPPFPRPPRTARGDKSKREQELKASLPEFRYDHQRPSGPPRLVYSMDEPVIQAALAAMQGSVFISRAPTVADVLPSLRASLSKRNSPLGFDIEWDPFQRQANGLVSAGPTALAQVCDERTILLIHLALMPGDARKLKIDFGYQAAGLLELNNVARLVDPQSWVNRKSYGLVGLQDLCSRYLDLYLPKDPAVRCGAWGNALSSGQRYCE
ncbi:hypothetical protein P7C70_g9588, partial [Phenoliferia sp. Uapishka_3]